MSAPPFDLSAPRYDQGTYGGRLAHFIEMTDMRMLLTTDAQLQQACGTISLPAATAALRNWITWNLRSAETRLVASEHLCRKVRQRLQMFRR